MPGIAEVLTRKLGPLPIWAWGGIGLGGAYLLYRSGALKSLGVGSSGTTPTPPAPSGADTALLQQELGMLQQIQGVQGRQGTASTAPHPTWQYGSPPASGKWVWHATPQGISYGQSQGVQLPQGQVYPGSNPPSIPVGAYGWQWAPVPTGTDPSGAAWTDQSYANALSAAGMGGAGAKRIPARSLPHAAMGGPARMGAAHGIWRAGHPMLGGPRAAAAGPADVTYPHYAMGGARNVHQVAAHMGIHPARVLAVNGHVKAGQARPGQIIRVA